MSKKAAHKALDIPVDDVDINQSRHGIGAFGVAAIAAAAALGPVAVAALLLSPLQPGSPVTPAPAATADSAYEVLFYDADGRLIDMPPLSERNSSTDP